MKIRVQLLIAAIPTDRPPGSWQWEMVIDHLEDYDLRRSLDREEVGLRIDQAMREAIHSCEREPNR